MNAEDCKRNLFQRQSSSDLSERILSLHRSTPFVSVLEDNEVISTIDEIPKLSLGDSTNTFGKFLFGILFDIHSSIIAQRRFEHPLKKFSNIPLSSSQTDENPSRYSQSSLSEPIESFKPSIADVFHSNLLALAQSNHPTNPFTPYAYSMSIYTQSPNSHSYQSDLFTPKRGTNPFDDDLIRR